jgi:GNAT superfamily N-acetyltransferase
MERARPATTADRSACAELLAQALGDARAARGGTALVGDATPASLLRRWRRGPRAALWVGEYEGVVVGVAAATLEVGAGIGRARIECCYVERGARAVGVGSALLEAALGWALERGSPEVDALALPGDRATKQRLEAAGFTARLLTLSRPSG